MLFFDSASFSTRVITDEGFLSARAKIGRPGIQEYVKGIDFKEEDLPQSLRDRPHGSIIRVLRPVEEVFKPESMATFEHKPITNDHPATKRVNSNNVKKTQVGFSQKVERVNDALEATVLIQDKAAIRDINRGKEQISSGYDADIEFKSGFDDVYGAYDGIMSHIVGNHIAIVARGRAGDNFRLQDEQSKGTNKMAKFRVIDGKQIELNDDAAATFDNMKAKMDAQASEIKTLKTKVVDAETKAEEAKGELDAVKAKAITDEDVKAKIDAAVKARIGLIDTAAKVAPETDFSGKTDREVKLTVIKTLADNKVEVKEEDSDDYVNAVFNTLVATSKPKSQKIADGLSGDQLDTADKARQRMIDKRTKKEE